jgi:hypothetical protein
LNQLVTYLSSKTMKSAGKASDRRSSVAAITSMTSPLVIFLYIVSICITLFMLCWFIAGCIWIFGVWNKVEYDLVTDPDFCQPILYRVAFLLSGIPLVCLVVCCCCPLCIGAMAMFALATQPA